MAFEVVKNIVEAEKEADSVKLKAQSDAESIVKDAEAKAAQMLVDAKNEAKETEKRLIKAAVEESRKEVEEIIAKANVLWLRKKPAKERLRL